MVLLFCGAMLALYFILCNARTLTRLPPGPISVPIFGSIFFLRYPLHCCFASLGKIYGPIIHLRGGVVDYIVINSITIAREVLITHDLEFAYRPASKFGEYFSYGFKDIALAPYGESWKNLKQITSRHVMSNTRLDGVAWMYELEMAKSIKAIHSSGDHAPVNLTDAVGKFISDAFCMILFGSTEVRVLDLVAQIGKQAINVNIGNLFPALDFLDLHGVNKTMKETLMPELEQLLTQVIGAHKQNKTRIESQGEEFVSRDLTDVLLSLESLPDISIVALLTVSDTTHFSVWNLLFAQDILVAGVDTIKWTAVWAMAEVLRNSRVMENAQEEVKNTIVKSQLVKHSELVNLPYIEAIFKEVLRLHPVGALGVPHHNPSKATLAGYDIPKHCTVLINIWAIGHDPRHWDEPEVFRPERFLGDQAKSNQELMMPFSAGRRTCPGIPIASRVVPFVVASLLHAFDWKSEGEIDLSERSSGTLSCMPASELVAFASARLETSVYAC
ncbi:cytochrome P450 750A1-like [Selaginella moellendorffii]|uniref:cytochrome P450 750A1-like n=1 Tax=Selaginella moellendorffii TaxID=88036 RepID=UPI000D1CF799|nr:cytochrome P450 750A1-like [Selaginella moellendorffii]|eukprot:XP_024545453.1 cytochrome P450 750A1-like [Selaginella moellendorffii]